MDVEYRAGDSPKVETYVVRLRGSLRLGLGFIYFYTAKNVSILCHVKLSRSAGVDYALKLENHWEVKLSLSKEVVRKGSSVSWKR